MVYRALHYGDGKIYDGVISGSDLHIASGVCSFDTSYFGEFQVMLVTTPPSVATPAADTASDPIIAEAPVAAFNSNAIITATSPAEPVSNTTSTSQTTTTATTSCGDIASGDSATRIKYQAPAAASGATCISESQTALCTNGTLGAFTGTYTYDSCSVLPPLTVSVTSSAPAITTSGTIPVTVIFASPVTGFDSSKVVIGGTNGSSMAYVQNFSGSGTTYSFDLFPNLDGTITVSIPSGAGVDLAGSPSLASSTLSLVFDANPPVAGGSGILTITGISTTSVSFSWHAATDAVADSSHITYQAYMVGFDHAYTTVADLMQNGTPLSAPSINLTSATFTGLTPNTPYHFNVIATDEVGHQSLYQDLREPTATPGPACTNGHINAIASDGVMTYFAGSFTMVGKCMGGAVPLSAATGRINQASFPVVSGGSATVAAVLSDGNGGWYIGGSFTTVGTTSRSNVAHITSTGTVDTSFSPSTDGPISALALYNSVLYLGGNFTQVNSISRTDLAAVNSADGSLTTWDPEPNGQVYALLVSGTSLYAGGAFTAVGTGTPTTRHNLASFDLSASGALGTWDPEANGTVKALALAGSTIYVGGALTTVGNVTTIQNLAAIDATSGVPSSTWIPAVNSTVNAIVVQSGTVYIAGSFTQISGSSRTHLGALDATSGTATSWNPSPVGSVSALASDGTNLYAGGSFVQAAMYTRNGLAAFNLADGSLISTWDPETNNQVDALAVAGGTVFAAGSMTTMNGQARTNIAAVDLAGNITALNSSMDGEVYSLATGGDLIYLGGAFSRVGGRMEKNIAAIDRLGNPTSFYADAEPLNNGQVGVNALVYTNGKILVGGSFSALGGNPASNIGLVDGITGLFVPAPSSATPWNSGASADGAVKALAISGATIYAGGDFANIGGAARAHVAALDLASGSALSWAPPGVDGTVNAIVPTSNAIYIGGSFANAGNAVNAAVAALDPTNGTSKSGWCSGSATGSVQTLVVAGNSVFVGGTLSLSGGTPRSFFAALDANTGSPTSFNPAPNDRAGALAVAGSTVFVGGYFSSFAGLVRSFVSFDSGTGALSW